jgi:phosphate uptake regulator
MKTYEDEAFDELEKSLQRKVAHGVTDGSKKDVALKQALEALEDAKKHGFVYVNEIVDLRQAISDEDEAFDDIAKAQQRKVAHGVTDGSLWRKRQEPEQPNFCSCCGKRIGKNEWDIHTCTPPLKGNNT